MKRMIVWLLGGLILLLFSASASAQAPAIKVVLLGTGRPDPVINRFGPATLVESGDQKLLFDCGRGVTQRLWQKHIPLSAMTAVFFTHLHSDHTVGFPDLWLTGWLPTPYGHRTQPMQVYGPKGTSAMMAAMRKAFAADIRIRHDGEGLPLAGIAIHVSEIDQGVVYDHGGVRVTAFHVFHGPYIKPAFGYRVDYKEHSVVISGDVHGNENLVKFSKGVDVIVHEVIMAKDELLRKSATARRIVGFHTTPEAAGKVFAQIKPKLAVYTHVILLTTDPAIARPDVGNLIPRTHEYWSGPLVVGEDLMTIDIGDKVEVHRFRSDNRIKRTCTQQCAAADRHPATRAVGG